VAEAYKAIVSALGQNPPDYATVSSQLDGIKAEMEKEFGSDQVNRVQEAVNNQDSGRIISEFQVVLVRNVERRLDNLGKIFDDYPQAKLLLAKAQATYTALAPTVQEKNPETDQEISDCFNQALEALGNPGLFGVGKKAPDRELYDKSAATIVNDLKSVFNTTAAYEGHQKGTGPIGAGKGGFHLGASVSLIVIVGIVVLVVVLLTLLGRKK
jgi:hypothetical protein